MGTMGHLVVPADMGTGTEVTRMQFSAELQKNERFVNARK